MPFAQAITAEWLGSSLLGRIQDGESRAWARAQLSRTSLPAAMSVVQSAVEFTSHEWIAEVDVPTAVVITRPTSSCRQVDSAGWPAPSRMLLCSS